MTKQRFFIATSANDDEAYREAMQYACKLAASDPEIKKVVLLISGKQSTGWFERLFDRETVKKLFIGTTFKNCTPIFKFETKKTFNDSFTPSEIVISCGLNSDDVLAIDDFYAVKAIIAIPWLEDGLSKWVQTWNPIEIRGNQQKIVAHPEPSCIVKHAMQDLTASINMVTGITHPADEELAKTFVLALYKYEPSLNADIVGAYLVRELNWDTDAAKDVERLIATLNNGKYFQGGERTGLQNHYKQWKTKCDE